MRHCKLHADEVQYRSWEAMDLLAEGMKIKPEHGNFSQYSVVLKAEKQIDMLETLIPQVESMSADLYGLLEKFKPYGASPFSETLTSVRSNGTLKKEEPTQFRKM